jgi:hypothetical protein
MMLKKPVRVFTETAICRTPRGLHIGNIPMLRSKNTQKCLRVHRACPDFNVERLLNQTTL